MKVRGLLLRALLVAAIAGGARAQGDFASSELLQIPEGLELTGYQVVDVDGDGGLDLVFGVSADEDRWRRELRIHLRRREGGFSQTPSHAVDLPRDVVGFAVIEGHADAGKEVVLFNARTLLLWRPRAEGRERFAKIGELPVLWQLPRRGNVLSAWEMSRDVDGDGLEDLVVPGPDGYRLLLQRREEGAARFLAPRAFLLAPESAQEAEEAGGVVRREGNRIRVSLPVPGGDRRRNALVRRPPLVDLADRVPEPRWLDFDGDGDLDLMARGERRLEVWLQGEGATFSERPAFELEVPVVLDRARLVDVSYSSHLADLDLDGKADCVMLAGDQRAEEARTQVLVFLQGRGKGENAQTAEAPLFGPRGRPQQVLALAGFAGQTHLVDVDGDGALDLAVAMLRPELVDAVKSDKERSLEIEMLVFLNRRGLFSRDPDLRVPLAVKVEGFRRANRSRIARFFADLTGDGVRELVVRDRPDRVRVLFVRKDRSGALSVLTDRPLWESAIDEDAGLAIPVLEAGERGWLAVAEDHQIRLVTFGGRRR